MVCNLTVNQQPCCCRGQKFTGLAEQWQPTSRLKQESSSNMKGVHPCPKPPFQKFEGEFDLEGQGHQFLNLPGEFKVYADRF